jgi:Protein of unknown function (DUF3037)
MASSIETRTPRVPSATLYYTVFRFVPDPIREEFINVALAVTDDAGQYSRLDFNHRIEQRLRILGAEKQGPGLLRFLEDLVDQFDVGGAQALMEFVRTKPALQPTVLQSWADAFATSVRLTPPRVFLADNADMAFDQLYRRLVGKVRQARGERVPSEAERGQLRRGFIHALRGLPNFSSERVQVGRPFRGLKAEHWIDVVVVGQEMPTAFAHALPFNAADARDIFLHRGTVFDAASDSPQGGIRLALYDDPPAERDMLLTETREILAGVGVELFRKSDTAVAAHRFEENLLGL